MFGAAVWLACFAAISMPPAHAHAEEVQVSTAQAQYNQAGVEAMGKGDFDNAITQFQSSLRLGEFNIIYLNLGRAMHRAGRCDEAIDAYKKTAKAPAVSSPTAEEVAKVLGVFEEEMLAECNASIQVTCADEGAQVQIDALKPVKCGESVTVVAGKHTVVLRRDEQETREEVSVGSGESKTMAMALTATDDTPPPPVVQSDSILPTLGWVSIGLGAALVGAGLAVDLAVTSSLIEDSEAAAEMGDDDEFDALRSDAESSQAATIGLVAAGGVFVVGGVVLLLLPRDSDGGSVSFVPLKDGAALTYSLSW